MLSGGANWFFKLIQQLRVFFLSITGGGGIMILLMNKRVKEQGKGRGKWEEKVQARGMKKQYAVNTPAKKKEKKNVVMYKYDIFQHYHIW